MSIRGEGLGGARQCVLGEKEGGKCTLSLGEAGQDEAEGGEAHWCRDTKGRLWAGGGGWREVEDVGTWRML